MSRRGRAIAFLFAAALAAAAAAAVADGYGASVARGYGAMRPVVVAAADLPAGRPIGPSVAASGLELRRVPARFVPPGTLEATGAALGLAPRAPLPAGSYLLVSQLRPASDRGGGRPGLGRGLRPVTVVVGGAAALLATASPGGGERVDVVETTEPRAEGPGRARVIVTAAPLLAISPAPGNGELEGAATATLGLRRPQALRLIAAQSFARGLTLLPRR